MTLYLLPNVLGDNSDPKGSLPPILNEIVPTLNGLIAESEGGGRRFLTRFPLTRPAHHIPIGVLNRHTKDDELDFHLGPIRKGESWGLISDAGLPCIMDPGASLVRRARQTGIVIRAIPGPSSFLHALILSGLPAQQFSFHGYLEMDEKKRLQEIREMEKGKATHIFAETPYRNQKLLELLVSALAPTTWLAVAWELTLPGEGVLSQPVAVWRKSPLVNLEKRNAVFLVNGGW